MSNSRNESSFKRTTKVIKGNRSFRNSFLDIHVKCLKLLISLRCKMVGKMVLVFLPLFFTGVRDLLFSCVLLYSFSWEKTEHYHQFPLLKSKMFDLSKISYIKMKNVKRLQLSYIFRWILKMTSCLNKKKYCAKRKVNWSMGRNPGNFLMNGVYVCLHMGLLHLQL